MSKSTGGPRTFRSGTDDAEFIFFVAGNTGTQGNPTALRGEIELAENNFDVYAADPGSALPGSPISASNYTITEIGEGDYRIVFSVATYFTTEGLSSILIMTDLDAPLVAARLYYQVSDDAGVNVAYWDGEAVPNLTANGLIPVDVIDWTGDPVSPLVDGLVPVDIYGIEGDTSTASTNLRNAFNGTGYEADTAPAQMQQVRNIAVTSAALNTVAASRTLTTGTETGTLTNAQQDDGTTWDIADSAGTTDVYVEFDLSATSGAVAVGCQWNGYLAGIVNTMKVYARNWGGASWDQIGTIAGIAGVVQSTEEFELTSAHTQAGLVRIRFSNTGLTSSSLKTDRLLLGYAVVGAADNAAIADAVWDEARAGHVSVGTFGEGVVVSSLLTAAKDAIVASIMAFVIDSGGAVPATVKGALRRIDAVVSGAATGLIGDVVRFFMRNGTAVATEHTQDVTAGTRSAGDITDSEV